MPSGQSWHTHSTWPQKKLRDNCTEVLAGKDLFAIFALAIEASSIAKLHDGALVQLVRMPACHAGGHRFESGTHRKSGERRWATKFFKELVAHSFFCLHAAAGLPKAQRQKTGNCTNASAHVSFRKPQQGTMATKAHKQHFKKKINKISHFKAHRLHF